MRHRVLRSVNPTPITNRIDARYITNTTVPAARPKKIVPTIT